MKKLICGLVAAVSLASAAFAADFTAYPEPLKKNDFLLNVGAGLLGYRYGKMKIPPISVTAEAAPFKIPLTLGGFLAYAQSSGGYAEWDYNAGSISYDMVYSYYMFGARAAYHFNFAVKGLDPYIGLTAGYSIVIEKKSRSDGFLTANNLDYFIAGGHLGVRYFFVPQAGLFLEIGYGISIFNMGITVRY
jgi:opacity protein-like surface antigen